MVLLCYERREFMLMGRHLSLKLNVDMKNTSRPQISFDAAVQTNLLYDVCVQSGI